MNPSSLELAQRRYASRVMAARTNHATFCEFALTHERTGGAIFNGQHHRDWHRFLDDNQRAVIFAPVEHGKTTQIAVGRTLSELGRDPSIRVGLISNTSGQAEKLLQAVSTNIENNHRLKDVFPHLRRSLRKRAPWHSKAIEVDRPTIAKDPSVQALGVGGPIVGSRLDVILLDDILDFENTRTKEQREKLVEWFDTTVLTRLTENGRIYVIGTPWHLEDMLHVLSARSGWATLVHSAVANPDDAPTSWIPTWPSQFPLSRLLAIAASMPPLNFARKYLCQVRSTETARFQQAWIDQAISAGKPFRTFPLLRLSKGSGEKLPTFTGVELAIGASADSDLSVIFTIAVDERGRRIVLDIQSGRWLAPEILARLKAAHDRYDSILTVENNGAQAFLLQWATDWGVPVRPFTTGRNKYDERFGVESIAVEMMNGKWVIPSGGASLNPEIQAWIREMLYYDPESHTGDRLMASWFARESARHFERGIQRSIDTLTR